MATRTLSLEVAQRIDEPANPCMHIDARKTAARW